MKVYKRKDRGNDWWVYFRYDCPDAKKRMSFRKRSPHQTRAGAEKWGRAQLALHCDPRALAESRRVVPTLAQFKDEWLAWQSTKAKPSTIESYASKLRAQILPAFGHVALDAIGPRQVAAWVASRADLSIRTRSAAVVLLRQILRQAKRWEIIDSVPEFDVPRPPEPEAWTCLEPDEAERLLAVCDRDDPALAAWVRVALNTGLRLGEILGLKWSEVDLERRELRVVRQRSKGREMTPKSGKARTVPLPRVAVSALRAQKARTFLASEWVWVGAGNKPLSDCSAQRAFKGACKRAGIRQVRVHDLRHTYASTLVRRGVGLQAVQELLGHHSVVVTQRYAHLAPGDLSRAVDVLDLAPGLHQEKVDGG